MATSFSDPNAMLSCNNDLCGLDSNNAFISSLLKNTAEPPTSVCSRCIAEPVNLKCRNCNEYLCDKCARVHLTTILTKDHCIYRISGSPLQLSPQSQVDFSPNGNVPCKHHVNEVPQLFCESCCVPICSMCTVDQHRGHGFVYSKEAIEKMRTNCMKRLVESRNTEKAIKVSLDKTEKMIETCNMNANQAIGEIQAVITKFQSALKERECELIKKVEAIRQIKNSVFLKQTEELRNALDSYASITGKLSEAIDAGIPADLLNANAYATKKSKCISKIVIIPENVITFVEPECALYNAVASIGVINATSFSHATIDVPLNGLHTRVPYLSISSISNCVEDTPNGQAPLITYLANPKNCYPPNGEDRNDSGYSSFQHNQLPDCNGGPGSPLNNFYLFRNRQLLLSWFPPSVSTTPKYNATLTFGREGDGDGELCRPWGVCCGKEGSIIVADRSNNRIQVFNSDGRFLYKFGRHGSEPGQFDRPAGVAVNPVYDIVVADKDNHRIQIFSKLGEFKFTFGDKGSKNGQFNYPWDIDVNSEGLIVVSDTRNHRIQLFAPDGSFLNKYGFETSSGLWKHFDSPRGVAFSPFSAIIVTDFNNHRLVVIEHNCTKARFLGSEGSGTKQFLRPQGIAVDCEGHVVVADSRNNRIQVFETNGNFLYQFGIAGQEPGQLDRPSGVCITPEGKIVVVDFGNNRIQIF